MAIISIDGVDLPAPVDFDLPNMDLDSQNSRRNEVGLLLRDRIRQGIFKLELKWEKISSSELHTIKQAIAPESVQVTFITEIGYITKTMYAGDRKIKLDTYDKDNHDDIKWNINFNLTEF